MLVGSELGLRLAGYGYPTRFFLPSRIDGQDVLVENARFGLRFFPSAVARNPAPVVMAVKKPAGTCRIFLFGESAALGDPRPAYGMGRHLQVLLQERFPETRFQVVCVAMTAINSHALRLIAQECAHYQGDLWLVYMGNNEMEGPFGAGTVFGPRAPGLAFLRASLAVKTTRTGQLIDAFSQRLRDSHSTNAAWRGMKMFLENQVRPGDPRRLRVYQHFERNLEDIVQAGLSAGCPVLLSTVASNLRDCAPFASLHSAGLSSEAGAEWAAFYEAGNAKATAGDAKAALAAYEKAASLDSSFAELHFRAAQCHLQLTNLVAARRAFEQARDYDALPFRAETPLNVVIQRTAARYTNCPVHWVNAQEVLARYTPEGIPGSESFLDHVHLSLEGNYRLARAFAEAVEPLLPEATVRRKSPDWAPGELCQRRLGLSDWNRSVIDQNVLQQISDAPFTNQLTHVAQRQQLLARLADLKSRLKPDLFPVAAALYQEALARAPRDHLLHENFAEFLEATGDRAEAIVQWQAVRELLPHHYAAYVRLARLLARQGKAREAEDALNKALRIEPRSAGAWIELGQLRAKEGKLDQAIAHYTQALRWQPENGRVHLYLADVLARQAKRPEAVEALKKAIQLRPSLWEARYLLGVEMAATNRLPEAQAEFEEVVRLRPDHVLARLNLGGLLAQQGRVEGARRQFEEVLRLDPENEQARQNLQNLEALRESQP